MFKIFNTSNSSSVGEEEFSKFAPIIVYALLPSEHHSGDEKEHEGEDNHEHEHSHDEDHDEEDHDEDGKKEITQNVPVYKEFLERYQTGNNLRLMDNSIKLTVLPSLLKTNPNKNKNDGSYKLDIYINAIYCDKIVFKCIGLIQGVSKKR